MLEQYQCCKSGGLIIGLSVRKRCFEVSTSGHRHKLFQHNKFLFRLFSTRTPFISHKNWHHLPFLSPFEYRYPAWLKPYMLAFEPKKKGNREKECCKIQTCRLPIVMNGVLRLCLSIPQIKFRQWIRGFFFAVGRAVRTLYASICMSMLCVYKRYVFGMEWLVWCMVRLFYGPILLPFCQSMGLWYTQRHFSFVWNGRAYTFGVHI